jgi:hypothetical protein
MSTTTILELDQEDIAARLMDDTIVGTVKVFAQRRGITENDIQTALGAVQGSKPGLVAIVLMPRLVTDAPGAPGPRYFTRYPVQVIDWPVMRRTTLGAGISAETLCERIRQILHYQSFGRGQVLTFDSMESAPMADETQISYIVFFRRLGMDSPPAKCATCAISPAKGTAPQNVTLTCATPSSSIYYSIDGSYPSALAAAATPPTAFLYTAPIVVATACTLRAAAEATNYVQGDVSQAIFT